MSNCGMSSAVAEAAAGARYLPTGRKVNAYEFRLLPHNVNVTLKYQLQMQIRCLASQPGHRPCQTHQKPRNWNAYVTKPADNPTASVIWLHGLGADATDFEPLVPMLDLAAPIRFIFPNAPVRPITINGGMEMRGWYDIDPGAPLAGTKDIQESAAAIRALVEAEIESGIASDRIALAGFSQGGVIALEVGLSHAKNWPGSWRCLPTCMITSKSLSALVWQTSTRLFLWRTVCPIQ